MFELLTISLLIVLGFTALFFITMFAMEVLFISIAVVVGTYSLIVRKIKGNN